MPSPVDILKCPFLRNINEPTNFSFSSMSSLAFPMPVSDILLLICISDVVGYVTIRLLLLISRSLFLVVITSRHLGPQPMYWHLELLLQNLGLATN